MTATLTTIDLEPYRALLVPLVGRGCRLDLESFNGTPARGARAAAARQLEEIDSIEAVGVSVCRDHADGAVVLRKRLPRESSATDLWLALTTDASKAPLTDLTALVDLFAATAELVVDAWRNAEVVSGMTKELATRYEELNLVYQMEDGRAQAGGDERRFLTETIAATREYLDLDVVLLELPDDGVSLMASGDGCGVSVEPYRALAREVCAVTRATRETLVLNRDSIIDWSTNKIGEGYKICVTPIVSEGQSPQGALIFCNSLQRSHFANSDRRMCEVVAAELAKVLQRNRDRLTGTLNRTGFETVFADYLARDMVSGVRALLIIDIDDFHGINDRHGIANADTLLRRVARLLRSHNQRHQRGVARLGADQFGYLLEADTLADLGAGADNLRAALAAMTVLRDGRAVDFTVSIGGIVLEDGVADIASALNLANISLRNAKAAGGNAVRVHRQNDAEIGRYQEELNVAIDLRAALAEQRFELYAQAIKPVRPQGNAVPYFEVLLRLREPGGAVLAPGRFIPVAERFKMMPELDAWVVEHSIAALGAHLANGGVAARLAVNLSGQSMALADLAPRVEAWLAQHRVPPSLLTVEVTETAAIANMDTGIELLEHLRRLGVRVALDDFGSGMSSFGYLRSLPVDTVKIDGSFVRGMSKGNFERTFVDVINRLVHAMGLETVAEFVEDEVTYALVEACHIDYAQGYLFSRPVPLAEQLAPLAGADIIPLASGRMARGG